MYCIHLEPWHGARRVANERVVSGGADKRLKLAGDAEKARQRMAEAVATDYARGSGSRDPMVELANVAIARRGWDAKGSKNSEL